MQRSKRFLAVAAAASLLCSSVAWAVALWVAPLGAYEVSLHMDDGRFAIVLDRRPSTARVPEDRDPAMNDGDGLHDEYVVTIVTLDTCSRSDAGKSAKGCGPAIVRAETVDVACSAISMARVVSPRAAPPVPASFSILRI
jgi:hypothetical protein